MNVPPTSPPRRTPNGLIDSTSRPDVEPSTDQHLPGPSTEDLAPARLTRRGLIIRILGTLLLIAGVLTLAFTVGIPETATVRAQVDRVGWAGPVLFAVIYGLCCLSPLPKTVLTLLAGAIFGVFPGIPVVIAGGTLGAVMAYFLARVLGRETVLRLTGNRLEMFDRMMDRRGFVAILVARLIPVIPFTAVNYLSGVTSLRLRDLVLGTVIGMVPATSAYVVMGSYGSEPGSWPFLAATGALILLSVVGLWLARRKCAAAISPRVISER